MKKELDGPESILTKIQERDRFIHVPYHSFNSFIRVLQEAATSPIVKTIKITLYRLAKESKVVKALICAARNGKKVTVSIELLARFDEASNIYWSKRMQEPISQLTRNPTNPKMELPNFLLHYLRLIIEM